MMRSLCLQLAEAEVGASGGGGRKMWGTADRETLSASSLLSLNYNPLKLGDEIVDLSHTGFVILLQNSSIRPALGLVVDDQAELARLRLNFVWT